MSRTRRRFRVSGVVQGVGFRAWTLRQGRALGLAGLVRNLPDGSVEVEAEGDAAALDRFAGALARGPAAARVTSVDLLPPSRAELPNPFEIAY